MGNGEGDWQDREYVHRSFGITVGAARRRYRAYVEQGIDPGRRPELTGGGMVLGTVVLLQLKREQDVLAPAVIRAGSDAMHPLSTPKQR